MARKQGGSRRVGFVTLAVAVLITVAAPLAVSAQPVSREGGYVYQGGESRFIDNVWNFIKWFPYEQYYWAEPYQFTSANNTYVDDMDIAYYSGHGNWWYIGTGPTSVAPKGVDTRFAGSWGDRQLEFIVFQSCQVIPAIPDTASWRTAWTGPGRVFQGVHQAIGYRTLSYSGNGISNNFGNRVKIGQGMWQAWFQAVNDERSWWMGSSYPGMASAVMYPPLENDTYYSFGADPPANHTWLKNWWQY